MKILKHIIKYIFLFLFGGLFYCSLETLYRGRTHWTMIIVGGLSFIFCGAINEIVEDMCLWKQMTISTIGITLLEFISGLILNVWLGLGIWNYSKMPLNIMGQICVPFMALWFVLSFLAILMDDLLRFLFFDEEIPEYRWSD